MPTLLPHYELLDPLGKPVFFRDVLGEKPTLLSFLRHFGCLFCFEHAATVLAERPRLELSGVQVVFVGNGNPAHAREFMHEHQLTGGVFTDPSRRLYSALEMHHGVNSTLNVRSIRHAKRAYQAGYRQTGVKGDPWQQGGNAAFDHAGKLLEVQRATIAGDILPVSSLVERLLRVTVER